MWNGGNSRLGNRILKRTEKFWGLMVKAVEKEVSSDYLQRAGNHCRVLALG